MARVRLGQKFQIVIPLDIRRKLGIQPGDTLIIDIQGDHAVLLREPDDWARASFGLHKEVWEDVDVNEYIRRKREAWRESATAGS